MSPKYSLMLEFWRHPGRSTGFLFVCRFCFIKTGAGRQPCPSLSQSKLHQKIKITDFWRSIRKLNFEGQSILFSAHTHSMKDRIRHRTVLWARSATVLLNIPPEQNIAPLASCNIFAFLCFTPQNLNSTKTLKSPQNENLFWWLF